MTRTIKLAVAAAMALGATSAFATNGDHLIGLGAKSRAMGGVSIGMSHGAESGITNPALLTKVKSTEISFGGTLFMPNVHYDANKGGGLQDSAADLSVIPEVSIANKVGDNFYWGIGIWGTAGMGTDYRDEGKSSMGMVTNLQLMQFGVPLTYAAGGFSIGVTPILQYGALDMQYNDPMTQGPVGAGVAQDLEFTYTLGVAYNMGGLTLGAVYRAEIPMKYKGQISTATKPFADYGMLDEPFGDNLTQPAEMGVGLSYAFGGNTIAFDFKQVKWGDAKGYKDFNWENVTVYSIGYEYAQEAWALRFGYNHGTQPIGEMDGSTQGGAAINMFNLLGFPATVENHFTAGGTLGVSEVLAIDVALTYAPESTTEFSTKAFNPIMTGNSVKATHSQTGATFQLTYAF